MGERLDKTLVSLGLVSTRSQASVLIKKGSVKVNGNIETKTGFNTERSDDIKLLEEKQFVSRGAYKLVHAIKEFNLDFKNKIIADCGASTGGFTEVALLNGASKVYAIDVGHDQINKKILNNNKVVNLEGVNLKKPYALPEKVDICVADLSFISITLVYKTMRSFLKQDGFSVVLIKPQFEAGRQRLGKGGVVKPEVRKIVLTETLDWFKSENLDVEKVIESPITGKDGNIEYLALIKDRTDI